MKKRESKKQAETKRKNTGGAMGYPIGDFLIRVKNAYLARNKTLVVRKTKLIHEVAKYMKKDDYLADVQESGNELIVTLFYRKKEPMLMGLKLVSTPGLRVYKGVDELSQQRGPTIFILSTPSGIMSSKEAIKKRIGGEVIAEVW